MTPASAARDPVAAHESPATTAADVPPVHAEGLVRRFSGRTVLGGVSLTIRPGECLALFGPNGAGKTTLLRIFAGLLKPTSGIASIAGHRLPAGSDVRQHVGIVSHHGMLYGALTARENVTLAARLQGLAHPENAAAGALERLGVMHRADAPVRLLSRGLQQRVAIARSVVHAPSVLLLDEPYTGLDEAGVAALTRLLLDQRSSGSALLLVTHNITEGLAMATHAAVLREGRIAMHREAAGIDPVAWTREYRELSGAA
jgi:heme exporter protein A